MALLKITILVDWDTARRVVPHRRPARIRDIEDVFSALQDGVAAYISAIDSRNQYRVYWRIYHGWYRGKTKTADRVMFERFILSTTGRTIRRVSFSTDYVFPDFLCCGSRRSPVFDTLRTDPDTGGDRQKMVDTMLVCDLLHLVRTRDFDRLIVIANDDDFVPALFTAEAWQGRVVMLHNRDSMNTHLNLDGIVPPKPILATFRSAAQRQQFA